MSRKRKKSLRLPNNYGGIVYLGKRRRKPYAVRITQGWTSDKKQIYKYIGYFEKETDALECLVEFNKNPYDIETKKITFVEIYERWSEKHFDKLSVQTARNYKSQIKKFESVFNVPFCELKPYNYQGIIDSNSDSNARLLKALLSNLYDYAINFEIVEKNYAKNLKMPDVERKEKVVFTKEEIDALWNYQGDVYADIILVLLYTGMRVSEILEMKSERVNFKERYMIGGLKTKAGIDRLIPIHQKILPIIKRNIGHNFVFEGKQGGKLYYNNHGVPMKKYLKKLNIEHTIHETRHTFISQCDRLKLNKIILKRVVGHKTNDITEHYTHKHIEEIVAFIDEFDY